MFKYLTKRTIKSIYFFVLSLLHIFTVIVLYSIKVRALEVQSLVNLGVMLPLALNNVPTLKPQHILCSVCH